MTTTYLFRLGQQGVDTLRKELEALGPAGTRAFQAITDASPRLADALRTAEQRAERARRELEGLQKQSDTTANSMAGLGRGAAAFSQELQGMGARLGPVSAALAAMGPAGVAASVAVGLLTAGLTKTYQATAEAERASLRLDAVLKATGNTAGLSRQQIDKMAESFQKAFHVDDDDIRQAAGTLATFKSVAGDAFQETIKQALNMRAVFGGDLQSSIVQLGKALETPTVGLTALRRSGVSFSESQKDLIASLEKTGDRAAAQQIILRELEAQIGGTAAAGAGGLTGAVDRLSVAWGNFWETAPEKLGPVKDVLEILARGIERVTQDLAGPTLQDQQATQWRELNDLLDKKKSVEDNPILDPFGTELPDLEKQIQAKNAELQVTRQLIQAEADKGKAAQKAAEEAAAKHEAEVKAEAQAAAAAAAREKAEKDAQRAAKAAADEAQRAAKARADATADATQSLEGMISALREETYQLGLSDDERTVRQKVMQAEALVVRGAVENGEELVAVVEAEAEAYVKARHAISDKKDAEKDAAKEAERQAKEREKIADREAELQLEPYKNAISGLQSAWTDGWEKVLGGNIDSFAEFFDTVKQIGIHWAAEMASLMTFKPVAGALLGQVPGFAQALGLGGSAAAQNGGASGIGGASGSLFTASAAPLAAMFGGAGGNTTGIGSWLFGSPGTGGFTHTGAPIGATSGLFGSMPGMSGFFNSGLGTGLIGAAVSAGVSLASGGSGLQAGLASGGSLIGGLLGSYFGPAGSMLGSTAGGLLGNLVGGLFGGKEKKPPKQQSITNIAALASGYFGAGDTTTKHSGDVTSELGRNAANAINTFLASIGGTVSGGGGGGQVLYYGRTPRFMSTVGGVTNQYGEDAQGAQDAVADFIARTMVDAAKSDRLEGVSDAVRTAIANSGAKDAAALDAAVAFGKFYDRVDKIRTPADAAAKAMADLAAEMSKAEAQAQDYGLAVEQLPEIFRQNFIDDIADQILQLRDPTAFALKQLELDKAAAIAQATSLGADLNAVEELYGLKRQAIVEQGLRGVSGAFQDFFNGLLTDSNLSALSPQEQYKVTKAAFEGASNDNLISAATPFLQASRGMFASSKGYADDFRAVLERVKAAGGLTTDIPFFAKGGDHGGGWMVAGEQGPELIASGAARVFDAQTTAAIMAAANADLSPAMMAKIVKSLGQGPDTELAHLMPGEIADLIEMRGGRPPSINPITLMPAFRYDRADTKAAGGKSGTAGGDRGRTSGGSGSNASDRDKAAAAAFAFGAATTNLAGPNPGDIAGGGIVGPNGYMGLGGTAGNQGSSTLGHDAVDRGWAAYGSNDWVEQQDKVKAAIAAGVSPTDITKAAEAYGLRLNDYYDRPNSFVEDVGNFFASWFGFNEIAPTLDFNNLNPNADWGFDPAGLIGGVLGMGLGLPFGGGIIADLISRMLGRPLEMNLGPNAFTADPGMTDGVANGLAAQGASDISIGGTSVSANSLSAPAGGVLGSGGDVSRTLSAMVSGGSGGNQTGVNPSARTAVGGNAQLDLLAQLLRANNDKLDRLLSSQAQTNDVLKQNSRGSTNQLLSRP